MFKGLVQDSAVLYAGTKVVKKAKSRKSVSPTWFDNYSWNVMDEFLTSREAKKEKVTQ
jgi:hypothetical protein